MQHLAHWDEVEGARREAGHWCPRSGKVSLRGIGVLGRIEQAGYWDGEP